MVIPLKNEAATAALGARIAKALTSGDEILLSGPLGAGKTALARAILRARGITEHVPSPTFTLVQSYDTPGLTLHHFDLYRLKNPEEVNELGLGEARDDGAVLIEWPERAPRAFGNDALRIEMRVTAENAREAHVAGPERWRGVLVDRP